MQTPCLHAKKLGCEALPKGMKRFGAQFNRVMAASRDYLKTLQNVTTTLDAIELNYRTRHDNGAFLELGYVLC